MRPWAQNGSHNKAGTILLEPFGSVAVRRLGRALPPHAHAQFNLLFKLGGADIALRIDNRIYPVDNKHAALLIPWVPHAKLHADAISLALLLHIEPTWPAGQSGPGERRVSDLFAGPLVGLSPSCAGKLAFLRKL
jgi:hypothetical protein